MKTKSVMYAAVGAPVVAARKIGERASALKGSLDKQAAGYSKKAEARIEAWAAEGEKVVGKVTDGKVVEEFTAKIDLDQAREQVIKLRDQLEDMLATWRASFRPEKAEAAKTAEAPATEPAPKAPAAKKPAAKKPAAKKPAAKTSTARATKSAQAAKTSTEKTGSASASKAS